MLASMIASVEKLICHCCRIIGVYLCSVYDPPHVARLYPRTNKPSAVARVSQVSLHRPRVWWWWGGSGGPTCVYMDLIACQWYYCSLELI